MILNGQDGQLQRAKSLIEQAADAIRGKIVRGEFELGAPLSENSLALELGVSKTPIREALLQLKSEGLVSILPQRGSFVFSMSHEELRELGELRQTLETTAFDLAARRDHAGLCRELELLVRRMATTLERNDTLAYRLLDAEFHQAFFKHAGNRYLAACYLSIAFRVQALRTRLSSDPLLNRSSFNDHETLAHMIAAGQLEDGRALLAHHISGTTSDYAASMEARRPALRL